MLVLLQINDFFLWQLTSFFERQPAPSATIVLQGKCDLKTAPYLEKEIISVINGVAPNGYVVLHGDAGDFGLSSDLIHSDGVKTIDGRGLKVLANCYDHARKHDVHLIAVFSNPEVQDFFTRVSNYISLPFPICSGEKQVEDFLQTIYSNPSADNALPA